MYSYDAVLIVSFGGPEGRDDVIPFLENVLRGKPVPRARMLEVAEHYYHFDGISPINAQNRDLIAALEKELETHGPRLPVYWGNRNWDPLLADTLRQMRDDGVQRAIAFFTSAYSSYSGCRQYREDIQRRRKKSAKASRGRQTARRTSIILVSSKRWPIGCDPRWTRFPPTAATWHASSSPPTVYRLRWPPAATTKCSFAKHHAWLAKRSHTTTGTWSIKAAAARRRSRGWNRMYAII